MPRFKPKYLGHNPTSDEQEERLAEDVGGRRQRGSGRAERHKGDVKEKSFLIEAKGTKHNSMRITAKWLAKITKEAYEIGRYPALEFELYRMDDPLAENRWIAIPLSVFMEYISASACTRRSE